MKTIIKNRKKNENDKKGERMTNTSTTEEFAQYLFDF
jgi:hypothetical protein